LETFISKEDDKMTKTLCTICLVLLFSVCGCGIHTHQQMRQLYLDTHKNNPELSVETIEYILAEKIVLGMTKNQVLASWGQPRYKNESINSWGTCEQWVYGNVMYSSRYLYFENGMLTNIQSSD